MKKIVYIVGGIYQPSGMGQVLSCKVNYLAETTDWQVYVVLTERSDLPFFYKLSSKISIVNFDINFDELDVLPLVKKCFSYYKKQFAYKKLLRAYLMEVKPDITVSAIRREINFLNDIPDGSAKVGEIHFAKQFYRRFDKPYLPDFVNKLVTQQWQNALVKQLARLRKFVVLTEQDAFNWSMLSNVTVIPNPLGTIPSCHSKQNSKVVISVGRYDCVKGFDLLISAWAKVSVVHPDWALRIIGPGERDPYLKQISELNLNESITCMKATQNVFTEMAKASLYVLSSRYEGFGMVLVEAMACGLPCVSFDCPSGPRDIISDHEDGILVENGNVRELADQICFLIENDDIRREYAERAIVNAGRYRVDMIMEKWIALFQGILLE